MATKRTATRNTAAKTAAPGPASAARRGPPVSVSAARGPAARVAGKILDTQRSLLQAGLRAVMPAPKAPKEGGTPWGFASLEEVFDQRVASTLLRLGVPTAQQFEALEAKIALLIERLDGPARKTAKSAPSKRGR